VATVLDRNAKCNIHIANGEYSSDVQHLRSVQRIMRLQIGLLMLACCALAGCHTNQPPVTRETLVGSYVYKSEDPEGRATDHEWDHLTLRADGHYELVQGGPTKAKSEKTGFWRFYGGDRPEVDLDHAGYPIQAKGSEIRLLIDNDVGIWYEKVK
jgi:hypothetical protein